MAYHQAESFPGGNPMIIISNLIFLHIPDELFADSTEMITKLPPDIPTSWHPAEALQSHSTVHTQGQLFEIYTVAGLWANTITPEITIVKKYPNIKNDTLYSYYAS